MAVLLSGGPGAGKSSVSQLLRDRGCASVDLDYGIARWEDRDGQVVGLPDSPNRHWLDHHFWRWGDRLDQALTSSTGTTVFAGSAADLTRRLDLFDLVLVLLIDEDTQRSRLADPARNNDFGRVGETAAWSHDYRVRVEAELLAHGALPVDARPPLTEVVEAVLRACRDHGFDP